MWALGGRPSLSTKDPWGPWHHSQMTSTDATSAAGGSPPPTGHPAWSRSGHAFPQVKSAAGESQKQLTRRKPIFESEDAIKYNNCVGGGRGRGEMASHSQTPKNIVSIAQSRPCVRTGHRQGVDFCEIGFFFFLDGLIF